MFFSPTNVADRPFRSRFHNGICVVFVGFGYVQASISGEAMSGSGISFGFSIIWPFGDYPTNQCPKRVPFCLKLYRFMSRIVIRWFQVVTTSGRSAPKVDACTQYRNGMVVALRCYL